MRPLSEANASTVFRLAKGMHIMPLPDINTGDAVSLNLVEDTIRSYAKQTGVSPDEPLVRPVDLNRLPEVTFTINKAQKPDERDPDDERVSSGIIFLPNGLVEIHAITQPNHGENHFTKPTHIKLKEKYRQPKPKPVLLFSSSRNGHRPKNGVSYTKDAQKHEVISYRGKKMKLKKK